MKFVTRQFYTVFLMSMILLCAVSIGASFWAVGHAEKVHAELVKDQIYGLKMTFLRDTVQNMLRDIDRLRNENRERARAEVDHLLIDLRRVYDVDPAGFERTATDILGQLDHRETLRMSLERRGSGTVAFSWGERRPGCPYIDIGPYRLSMEVDEAWVDSAVKSTIADIIHSQSFEYDGYIWVNEVIDWAGGDGYAIRRIHPNLPETEGSLLSTKTADIKGNLPYLTELEGVKKDGELYSRYYFKRKGSDEISEKLTYAALYADYGWIVAMGIHVDDIETYSLAVREASEALNSRVILMVVVLLSLFFGLGMAFLILVGRRFIDYSAREIRKESNTDPLTGALNRRIGAAYFAEAYRAFRLGKPSPMVFSFDLDDFKRVNDTFGHEAGDVVLRAVADQAKQTMRASDFLFRWGGEEFILVYNGVTPGEALRLAERLNRQVASATISLGAASSSGDRPGAPEAPTAAACGSGEDKGFYCVEGERDRIVRVSISIGVSWFAPSDTTYEDVIKRSDEAMYRAKAEGKNCARIAPA